MGQLLDALHMADCIDVAADQMAAETVTEAQGRLEVHRFTTVGLAAQGGAAKRLLAHIGAETVTHAIRHGEADAIHRHTVAKTQWSEGRATFNNHTGTPPLNPANRLDQAREHRGFSGRFAFAIIG